MNGIWEKAEESPFNEPSLRFCKSTIKDAMTWDITFQLSDFWQCNTFLMVWSAMVRGQYRWRRYRTWHRWQGRFVSVGILGLPHYEKSDKWTMIERGWRSFWQMYRECRRFEKAERLLPKTIKTTITVTQNRKAE